MKRFISILLLIFILLAPFNGLAVNAPSPTMKNLIQFKPQVEFEFLTQKLTTLDLEYWEPFKLFNEYMEGKEEFAHTFHLDEALILFITEPLEVVEARLMFQYEELNFVYGIFVTEEEYVYVRQGVVIENGNVLFDLSEIHGNTIMFVLSNY